MRFLPVVERELRAAARQPRTYRSRLAAAAITVLIFAWMLWMLSSGSRLSGRDIFQFLSWIAFLYCLVVGVVLTADCLSAEKRENTLGLLFLTDLKGYDVVLGKLLATSLNCVFGLLAMFPVLAISVIMGGVQLGEFWREALHLANTLFLSVSVGLFVSAISRHPIRATVAAIFLIAFLGFGLPGISEILRVNNYWSGWAFAAQLASPFYTQEHALQTGVWLPNYFWASILVNHLIGLLFLGLACGFLPRAWRENPGRPTLRRWREYWRRLHFGNDETRKRFRDRLLEWNPFFWLSSRERVSSSGFLVFVVAVTLLAIGINSQLMARSTGRAAGVELIALIWLWTCLALQAAMLFKIAWGASQRFAEDRESGALELLLATPFPVRRILRGQWMALIRQLAGPVLAMILMHAFLLWGVLMLYHVETGNQVTVRKILWATFQNLDSLKRQGIEWELAFASRIVLAAIGLVAVHWLTLGWVAMWLGLRSKHARLVPWISMAIVLIPPWPLFTLIAVALGQFWFLWSEFALITLSLKIAIGLNLLNDLLLIAWAWTKLHREFRTAATERYQPKRKRRPWVFIKRAGIAVACAAAVIVLFYTEESWRGQRAWRNLQREVAARGERLDIASLIPPAVPPEQNFAEAPVLKRLFDEPHARRTTTQPTAKVLEAVDIQMLKKNNWTSELDQSWANEKAMDLFAWVKMFGLSTNSTLNRREYASFVQAALQVFDPVLKELQAASARPLSRFPIEYELGATMFLPHHEIFRNVGQVLRLRAVAALALGETDRAFEDVQLMFYLADSVRTEPFLESQHDRHALLEQTLQPIWEGLAEHAWSENQRAWIQQRCQQNLFGDFEVAIRGETILQLELWRAILSSRSKPPLGFPVSEFNWRLFKVIYPSGWIYQNQARTYCFFSTTVRPVIDSSRSRIFAERVERMERGLEYSGTFRFRGYLGSSVPGMPADFASAQTALNHAVVACALEAYWREHRIYPETLDTLVPQFIEALPSDVVTGESLQYKRTEDDRFILYSVGMNQIDDGGNSTNGLDWTWSYPKQQVSNSRDRLKPLR